MKKLLFLLMITGSLLLAQRPYAAGDTVLPEDNLSWTDNTGYSTTIFDEIAVNEKVVVIFWGGSG